MKDRKVNTWKLLSFRDVVEDGESNAGDHKKIHGNRVKKVAHRVGPAAVVLRASSTLLV